MKKLLYLFVASAILFSCESNDDESTLSESESIIGSWKLTSQTENNNELIDNCTMQSTITFSTDGTYSQNSFYTDNGSCKNETDTGTWKNNGNFNYTFNLLKFN